MPLKTYQGRYQAPRSAQRRRRRRRRQGNWIVPVLVMLLICSLAGAAAWATWSCDEPDQTEPPKVLELPGTVTLLTPVLPASGNQDPADFVAGLDGTGITVSFETAPAQQPCNQTVTLRFTDGDGVCTRQTTCYLFRMEQTVTVDASEGREANVRDFVSDEQVTVSFAQGTELKLDSCGVKAAAIECNGKTYPVSYIVTESIPPVGTAQTVTAAIGTVPDPATLLAKIEDDSKVTVTYKEAPELTIVGEVPVTLILTDAYGNTTEVVSKINVVPGADAPKFTGLSDIRIQIGDTISYKSGVTATDPQDGQVNFTVDAAAVNRNVEGVYTVYYSATDADGNTTIVPRKVEVIAVNQAAVEQYARAALNKIITSGMTRDQQIFAVYKYTKSNVQFVGSSDKSSIINGAYEGFTTGKGDCYTYYAMNVVMLDLLGIENLEVRRVGGTSNHWWNLVKYDDGKWYHVDSCPHAVAVENIFHWKMTEADIARYTADATVAARRPNFYVYDKTLPEYEGLEIAP